MIAANGTPPAITLVMADDHEIFRDGFKLTLSRVPGVQLVAEARDGQELVEMVALHQPQVVITDIKMPIMDGIQATRKIASQWPGIGIIGLSMFDDEELVIDMLEAGARGYLIKNANKVELIEAINTVYNHGTYYCQHTSNTLAQMIGNSKFNPFAKKAKPDFSDKEVEIILLICAENTNKEIGEKLFLSTRTVEGYRQKIFEKLEVKSSVGLVVYAMQNKIFYPGH